MVFKDGGTGAKVRQLRMELRRMLDELKAGTPKKKQKRAQPKRRKPAPPKPKKPSPKPKRRIAPKRRRGTA